MEIRNLFDPVVKQDIIDRINKLTPTTQRRWGKMDVSQMLSHVQLPISCAYGTHQVKGGFLLKVLGPLFKSVLYNDKPYKQTLVKYKGEWRLYINTTMLKDSPKHIGKTVSITVAFDPESRAIQPPAKFLKALKANKKAKTVFDSCIPSLQLEIVRYLANLKTEEALDKNITKAINFLLGKERFIGRDALN